MIVVIVGLVVIALLAGLFLATTARRRDRDRATGVLARETRKRDKGNPIEAEQQADAPVMSSSRELERATVVARRGGDGDLAPSTSAPPAVREPLDDEALGVTRRQFLNRGVVGLFAFGLSAFGAACIAFLWPTLGGGFGSKVKVKLGDAAADFANKLPHYVPEGRFYLNPYPKDDVDKAKRISSYAAVVSGMEAGYVALYQKCVHLGCRVPWCSSSQWFECPCHGSKYNRVGEKRDGPAPRGLDRFAIDISGDTLTVDTKSVVLGPPIGTNTTGQEIEGPHCA